MAQPPLNITVTQTDPIEGDETFTVSTHSFNHQLRVPHDFRVNMEYLERLEAIYEHLDAQIISYLKLFHLQGITPSPPPNPDAASLQFDATMSGIRLKIDNKLDELLLAEDFFFDIMSGLFCSKEEPYMALQAMAATMLSGYLANNNGVGSQKGVESIAWR
ncbi:MAG: hypothetical protein Q9168_007140, partial [Polycauliona sp. 1 TL-2023]